MTGCLEQRHCALLEDTTLTLPVPWSLTRICAQASASIDPPVKRLPRTCMSRSRCDGCTSLMLRNAFTSDTCAGTCLSFSGRPRTAKQCCCTAASHVCNTDRTSLHPRQALTRLLVECAAGQAEYTPGNRVKAEWKNVLRNAARCDRPLYRRRPAPTTVKFIEVMHAAAEVIPSAKAVAQYSSRRHSHIHLASEVGGVSHVKLTQGRHNKRCLFVHLAAGARAVGAVPRLPLPQRLLVQSLQQLALLQLLLPPGEAS